MTTDVRAFAWETGGDRFGVIHKTGAGRYNVNFYTMKGLGGKVAKLFELEKRQADCLFWSPTGRFVILAGIGTSVGSLEFFDVDKQEKMRSEQHAMITSLEWDPSGRYVATAVSKWVQQLENGYTIWSFQGKELVHVSKEKFFQFAWRPRPPSPLEKDKIRDIYANMKEHSKKLKKEDRDMKKQLWEENKKKREATRKDFIVLRDKRKDLWEQDRDRRRKLIGRALSDDEDQWEEIEIEVAEQIGDETVEFVD